MSDSKLNKTLFFATGLMLFALFFGAGNLIFPAEMGQKAGSHEWRAALGMVITGAGLPLLGVIAVGYAHVADVQQLAQRCSKWYGICFASLLYLSIGPLFAAPRTATVSFEMGIKPLLQYGGFVQGGTAAPWMLAVFSVFFFALAMWLSLSPGKLIDRIGKILTPVMLLCIAAMIAATLTSPLGTSQPPVTGSGYDTHPAITGFLLGYNTMDGLASLVFSIIVINALKEAGVSSTRRIMRYTIGAGLVAAICLGLVYLAVTHMGVTSVSAFGQLDNGADILSSVAAHYWGIYGNILLLAIVFLACLSTAVGLITANAEYFHRLIPKVSYRVFVVIFTLISMGLANKGLAGIIKLSVPALMLLYPLAIVLILLTFLHRHFGCRRIVYITTLFCTLVVGIMDAWKAAIGLNKEVESALDLYLPLYSDGLGWIVPAAVGFALGLLLIRVFPERVDVPADMQIEEPADAASARRS